ncbi:hypothetical protein [Nocardia sp. R7R-8]|uniref:hypothetical protein n=1 Tax=Nocardia sp. R7R-8 TaxID=3459304 RepID=UPI00403DF652
MDTAVLAGPESPRASRASARDRFRRIAKTRPVVVIAGCLIVAQLAIRWWVADSGFFYWDDFILVGRAARYGLWSTDLLLYNHDGHFMPLAFATAWAVTTVAPLIWAGPVVALLIMQLGASVAVVRMLLVIAGPRRPILIPLVFYLFCPLTIPAFAWWAAALNALPLQFALAWVIGDAVLLVRTGRRRYALSGIAVLVVALLFFEKSAVVPFVAFAAAALAHHVDGGAAPIGTVARRGAWLWIGSAAVLGFWSIAYLAVADGPGLPDNWDELRDLLPTAASLGIVPALSGGPWVWERWLPSTPWADPPGWAVVAAWLALAALVALSMRARQRIGAVWLTAAAYVVIAQLAVALARGGPNTAAELMQSLRYFADSAVVAAAAGALMLRARPRSSRRPLPVRPLAVAVTAVFVASSLWSTWTFVRSWRTGPSETYITNVRSALRTWDGAPLLEQEVPWNVLNPMVYPQNLTSSVLAPVAAPGTFALATPRLRMIADDGAIVDAAVWWNRAILPGPVPGCGHRVDGTGRALLRLDGPMLASKWTAQLNYVASRDGRISVALEHGEAVSAPVQKGMNTVFVRLVGSGSALLISADGPGLDLCVGVGPVGVASYDN